MKVKFKEILQVLSIPLSLIAVSLTVYIIWGVLDWPRGQELTDLTEGWLEKYGLWIIFISAIIEGVLILGQYYPGGLVIFLGVIAAGKNIPLVIGVVAIVSLAFFIAYTINYLIGKYGWYRLLLKFGLKKPLDNAQKKLSKHELNAVIFSYWEPNLASVTATAAGILQIPLSRFALHSALGIVIWNVFWGTLVFTLGSSALNLMGLKWILAVFVIWITVIVIKHIFDKRKSAVVS